MGLLDNSNLRFIKAEEEDKVNIFMIHMTEELMKVGIDQIAETEEFSLMDKVQVDQYMNRTIGEEILDITQEHTKIMGDKIVRENTEVIIGMKITAEKEGRVGLGRDHFQGILIINRMIEAQVIADQDLDQKQVQTGIESGVISVENMTILQNIAPHQKKKER